MRRFLFLIGALLVAASPVSAQQPRTSGSITAGGADCSVAARCVGLQVGVSGGTAAIAASGFGTATITVEISIDATSLTTGTWTAQPETYNLATGTAASTFAANGYYVVPLKGGQWVRARASSYSSGTIAIAIGASTSAPAFTPNTAQPISGTVTANAGSGTFTVAGSVTANAGTNLNTSALALDATVTGRLPAGGSPADNESNTNTNLSRIGAFNYVFDGATWDRWTGGVTQSGTWTVTANAGTNLNTSALALDATLGRAQGSTTSGQTGPLVQGAVTTSNPSYTTGQTAPLSLDTAGGLRVRIAASDVSSSGGTSVGDNAVFTGGTTAVTPIGALYDTTPPTITDGNIGAPRMNASRQLQVDCVAGCSGTSFQDNAAFTFNTTSIGLSGGVLDDTSPNAATENSAALARISSNRNWYMQLRDGLNNERGASVTAANALKVDGSAVTQPVSGTVTTTPPANASTNVAQYGGTNVVSGGLTGLFAVGGAAASGAAKSGNPIQIGGVFNTTQPTVTTGQAVEAQATNRGELLIAKGVSGFSIDNTSFTANAGTNLNTSALALSATQTDRTQKTQITDGTRDGTVKAASTAAAAADTSFVVALSPNSPIPSGANTIGAVTQASGPWTSNVTQFGGTNLSTGTGAGGVGIPRFTISSDSTLTSIGSITNTVTVQGARSSNGSAAGSDALAVLPGVATAAAPAHTEGRAVGASFDLAGALRVSGSSGGGVAQNQVRDQNNAWQDVGYNANGAKLPVYDASNVTLLQQLMALLQQQNGYLRGSLGNRIGSYGDALKVAPITSVDPCSTANKGNVAISQTTSTKLIPGVPGLRIFVCSARVIAGAAEILAFTEGAGGACATGETAVTGSATVANGESYAANGGFAETSGSAIFLTTKPGNDLCLKQNGANRLAGNLVYAYGQ